MALPRTRQDIAHEVVVKQRGPSSFVKAGIGLLTTATVDTIVAFSTSYWATWTKPDTGEHGGYGLWKTWHCRKHIVSDGEVSWEGEICNDRTADLSFPAWYVTTQVFMSLALAGIVAALSMLLLYMFLPMWHRSKYALSTLIAISYLSGLFIMVALFVFGFKVAEEIEGSQIKEWFLSWSFSLACTAFLLNQIAASILITENKRLFQGLNAASDDTDKDFNDDDLDQCEQSDDEDMTEDMLTDENILLKSVTTT